MKNPNYQLIQAVKKYIDNLAVTKNMIVGIDGASGAGKTTLATSLKKEMPYATIIHLDDFLLGRAKRRRALKKYTPEEAYFTKWYDYKKIKNLISVYKNTDKKFFVSTLDTKNVRYNLSKRVMIIDGIFLNKKDLFKEFFDRIIFLDISQDNLLMRREGRYMKNHPHLFKKRGFKDNENFERVWQVYMRNEKPSDVSDLHIRIKIV